MHRTTGLRRRAPVVLAAAVATAAATLSGQPAATAQPTAPAGTPAPAQAPGSTVDLHGVGPGPHTVTLLTGDRVTLSPMAGRYSVHVQPAWRPDSGPPVMLQQSTPDGFYVLPGDALAAVQAGRLDRELFNVTYLVENGYADAEGGTLPVIVQYPKSRPAASALAAADALPASTPTLRLDAVHGAALGVAKEQAGQFWAAVRGRHSSEGQFADGSLAGGVAKVWLDRRAHVTLDQSVPLIGAPQAWAAGYDGTGVKVAILDTGIDATHPDLAGKVVASRSFLDGVDTVVDDNGHGTHVASTITGTGAASGGKYKGVAPGATLVIGKVCDSRGQCPDSAILAGMQWAATSGARLVSMSLGGEPSDGTDVLSQAVNDLTAQTGTLFVIAAGNAGLPESVGSPGTADAALTVAATDKSDGLASFSSRGPRLDGGLKPDIAAPGVDITAARAAGTQLGPVAPDNDRYITISGTSMATPHVSGAVAILAQEHPDWTAAELKAALTSTSKDVGFTVYERGAGRLDVARATSAQVVGATANADFGRIVDLTTGPSTRDVTYRNLSDRDVTLTLTAALSSTRGTAADGALRVDPTLTVPAHGTATATVTLDPSTLTTLGTYTGAVTATAEGVSLTTPVGVDHEAARFELRVHTIGRDGGPITPFAQSTIDVTGNRGALWPTFLVDENTTVTRVPAGKVSVALWAWWVDADSKANLGYLLDPEVDVTGDTEITLDLRTASQVAFATPTPAEPINNWFDAYYQRTTSAGDLFADHMAFTEPIGSWGRVWVTPTRPVTEGTFRFATEWVLGKSEVDLSVVRPHRQALHAVATHHWEQTPTGLPDVTGHPDFRFFTGTQDLPVVDVGLGDPEDLTGLDLRGRLALATTDMFHDAFGNPRCGVAIERIEAIREAGAAGIVFYPGAGTNCPIPMDITQLPLTGPARPLGIPFTFLSTKEGLALHDQVATEPTTLRVTGTPETPYTYALKPYEEGRVPGSLHYTFGERDLAQVDLDVHAPTPTRMAEGHFMWKQDDDLFVVNAIGLSTNGMAFTAPRTRREWVGPLDPTVLHTRQMWSAQQTRDASAVYDSPVRLREQWFAGPVTPGAMTYPDKLYDLPDPDSFRSALRGLDGTCVVCRSDDTLWPFFFMTTGSGDQRWHDIMRGYWQFQLHLDKDGVEVPMDLAGGIFPTFPVDDGPGTYHLSASSPASEQNPRTDVRWSWNAGPVDRGNWQPGYLCAPTVFALTDDPCHPEPLVYASYDLTDSLAMDNTVPAGKTHRFTVDAYHSPSRVAMPAIVGLKLWASTDDGATWVPVPVSREKDGTFTATASYPRYDRTTGAVSLRVEAWDADGNRVEQTTMRAFALRDSRTGGASRAE